MTTVRPARAQAMRRYPALGFLAVAALLAVALPSALTVPNAGPPTLAEFAAVPGQGAAGGGDVGRLGSGSSGGPGSGLGEGGAPGQAPDPGQPSVSLKRCVGNPPRQTEDPLSPPCVAFFEGDNFGATAKGVTGDEIRVVLHTGPATESRFNDLDDPKDTHPSAQEEAFLVVARGLARYFNERYQTYGRRVRIWSYKGPTSSPAVIKSEIEKVIREKDPFAVVPLGVNGSQALAHEAAIQDTLAVSYAAFDRETQRKLAPRLIAYSPDLQDQARIVASFVCRKLRGRPARFSGNVADTTKERSFGLIAQERADEPELMEMMRLTQAELARTCGLRDLPTAVAGTGNEDQGDYALTMANLRSAGVTTVIAFSRTTGPLSWGTASNGWYPEWIVTGRTGFTGVDENETARQYPPTFWRHAFGLSFDRLRGDVEQQQWYAAFREGCPGCAAPSDYRNAKLYDSLNLLFWGIQAAGPRLTRENLDKGLHAIPARASTDPAVPAAYFAPANYSWIKDAIAVWWDGTATDPGGTPGCYKVARGGRRFRAGEWPAGDADLFVAGAACQGPSR